MVIKRASYGSALHFLNGKSITMQRYLQRFYPPYDWWVIRRFFMDNPIQAKVILKDFSKSNAQKLKIVAQIFIAGKSKIVFIVGARGSGKTATAFMFAEAVNNQINRPLFYVSNAVDEKILPKWMKKVNQLNDVPKGSFAIIDESAIQYSSRESWSEQNRALGKELAIARHREVFLIFITQHIAISDINIDRLKDLVIWKRSNDYSFGVRGKVSKEGKFWDKVRNMMAPRDKPECLFEFPSQRRFIHFSHELPLCWSDDLSRSWKDLKITMKREDKFKEVDKEGYIVKKKQYSNKIIIGG